MVNRYSVIRERVGGVRQRTVQGKCCFQPKPLCSLCPPWLQSSASAGFGPRRSAGEDHPHRKAGSARHGYPWYREGAKGHTQALITPGTAL